MEIEFTGQSQFFSLNSKDYTAYPIEQEVLLQDGIDYEVLEIIETR